MSAKAFYKLRNLLWPNLTDVSFSKSSSLRANQHMAETRKVGIVIFDEVEVLDFCGPFEVFSVTGGREGLRPFEVFTVAEESKPITARGGLSVNPSYSFESCPRPDILLVPGGF